MPSVCSQFSQKENGTTTVPTHREGYDKVCTATEAGCHKGGVTKRSPPATITRTHHLYIKKYANSSAVVHTFTFVVTLIGTLPHHFPVSSLLKGLAAYCLKGHSFLISDCL